MKKWIALLMAMVMMVSAVAFAEEAVFNWEIPAEAVDHGDTWTTTLKDKNIAFKVFVYEEWEFMDSSTYQPNVRAMWATEDGRTLEMGFATNEEIHVNTLEDAVAMVENAGYYYDILTLNGMDACLISTEDMTMRGMVALVPEGVLVVRVNNLTDESQVDEADNMILSVRYSVVDPSDVGVKQSTLASNAGYLIPVTINGDRVTMYLYNDYEDVPQDESWVNNQVGRRATADGRWVDFFLYSMEELGASDLNGVYDTIKNSGFEASINKINGLDAVCFYLPGAESEQGIALIMANDYVLAIKAGPIYDEAQETEAVQMLWSLTPAN